MLINQDGVSMYVHIQGGTIFKIDKRISWASSDTCKKEIWPLVHAS